MIGLSCGRWRNTSVFERLWKSFLWIWDYIYVYVTLTKWMLMNEIFVKHHELNLKEFSDRKGQVAVVTGGTGGLGSNVVKKLLQLDMHVIVGLSHKNFDPNKVDLSELRRCRVISGILEGINLELSSFASVREFVAQIQRKKLQINILINNAGICALPFKLTEDGFETQFQVNYLSHFLLTNLLLPNIITTAETSGVPGRIVMVSSSAQSYSKVNFDDIDLRNRYNPYMAYFNSKWMEAVMVRYLDGKLRNSKVYVNSLHPGAIPTGLGQNIAWVSLPIVQWFLSQILMNVDFGGDEILYVTLSLETAECSGEYFVQRKPFPIIGDTPSVQRKLWQISCHLTGVNNQYND